MHRVRFISTTCKTDVFRLRFLDVYGLNMRMEDVEGKLNMIMPQGSVPDYELIEARRFFDPDEDDRCHCKAGCWNPQDGHRKDHSCG